MPMRRLLLGLLAIMTASLAWAQSFTYQGSLKENGVPANGSFDFRFMLWTQPTGGVQVGPELYVDAVAVQNGLFTVPLDFGSVWDGSDRYLEIRVRRVGHFGYWLLQPRVKITPTPYAAFALRPWQTAGSAVFYNDGSVGIGTSNPAARLSLGGGDANTKLALWQGGTAGEVMGFGIAPNQFRLHLHNPNNRFSFLNAPDGSELLTILGNGNVGIGLTSPTAKLHIRDGNLRIDGGVIQSWGPITLHPDVDNSGDDIVRIVDSGGTEVMRVHSNGNVGIGTSSPSYPLHVAASAGDRAIYGFHTAVGSYGVYGQSDSTTGTGVFGLTPNGAGWGVWGRTSGSNSNAYGVIGTERPDGAGHAVYASGTLAASGTKSFQIDHPLRPETHYLNHFCAEGPEPYNLYRGTVVLDARGEAWVQLPAYFSEINRDPSYHLTPIGAPMPNLHVAIKIQGNRFKIAGGAPGKEVSWRVEAIRNDRWVQEYGFKTEQEKEDEIKGKYVNPELYGQPKERGIHYRPEPVRPNEGEKPQ